MNFGHSSLCRPGVLILILLYGPLQSGLVFAQSAADSAEKDERFITEYLRSFVRTLDHPIRAYHWSNANRLVLPILSTKSAYAFTGIEYALQASRVFWENYGRGIGGNALGPGFYLASDPEASRRYGEGSRPDGWVLVEVALRGNTRIFDLDGEEGLAPEIPSEVRDSLTRVGCSEISGQQFAYSFFHRRGLKLGEACRTFMHRVLDETLAVDAVAYHYNSSNYDVCPGDRHETGFVLMSARSLQAEDVRAFHARTEDAFLERSTIAACRYLAGSNEALWNDPRLPHRFTDTGTSEFRTTSSWVSEHLSDAARDPFGNDRVWNGKSGWERACAFE